MSNKSEFIKIAVTPERKHRWKEAVSETPNVGTLSGMIRLAVESKLEDSRNGNDTEDQILDRLSEVLDTTQEMQLRFDELDSRLRSIERVIQDDEELAELSNAVFAALPTLEDLDYFWNELVEKSPSDAPEDIQIDMGPDILGEDGSVDYSQLSTARSGRIHDIARVVDADEQEVQRAIKTLQEDTARVQTEKRNGHTVYWKEV